MPPKDAVAWVKYDGHYYWAQPHQIEENDLYIIDPTGLRMLLANYRGNRRLILVRLKTKLRNRIANMRRRGDGWGRVIRRVIHDLFAFATVLHVPNTIELRNNGELRELIAEAYIYLSVVETMSGGQPLNVNEAKIKEEFHAKST
jgi:hypothetical protein